VSDARGDVSDYTYDRLDQLRRVMVNDEPEFSYWYDGSGRVTYIYRNDRPFLRNRYDSFGRITEEAFADGRTFRFAYRVGPRGDPVQTTVVDPQGRTTTVRFNECGYEVYCSEAQHTQSPAFL
jgi:YD repeat-containing protein